MNQPRRTLDHLIQRPLFIHSRDDDALESAFSFAMSVSLLEQPVQPGLFGPHGAAHVEA